MSDPDLHVLTQLTVQWVKPKGEKSLPEATWQPKDLLPRLKKLPAKRMLAVPNITSDALDFRLFFDDSAAALPPGFSSPELATFTVSGALRLLQGVAYMLARDRSGRSLSPCHGGEGWKVWLTCWHGGPLVWAASPADLVSTTAPVDGCGWSGSEGQPPKLQAPSRCVEGVPVATSQHVGHVWNGMRVHDGSED